MLSASEISDLEKKVSRYRLKRYTTFFGALFISVAFVIGIGMTFYIKPSFLSKFFSDNKTNIATHSKEHEENRSLASTVPNEQNTTATTNNETLSLSTPKVFIDKNIKNDLPKKESRQDSSLYAKNNLKETNSIEPKDEPFYRSPEDKIDTSVLKPPGSPTASGTIPGIKEPAIKPKGSIKIETQETHSIPQLKERFEKTQNGVFAVMLAEEFYNTKNYKESVKWSLIANQLEPENDKSWIWFAKSKVKLGEKEDAITALKAFLVHNKSTAAQALLSQITLGETHE